MTISRRVLARHIAANLEVGRSLFTEHLKIHRYRESLEITDLTNAGKRGKRVRILMVDLGHVRSEVVDEKLKQASSDIASMAYDEAKRHLEQDKDLRLSEVEKRGIDVEPAGTKLELKKKFPDGTILEITASPHSFLVKNSTVIRTPNPEQVANGYYQDTLYYPKDKRDGIVFYTWLKANMAKAGNMNIRELEQVWDEIGVRYSSH